MRSFSCVSLKLGLVMGWVSGKGLSLFCRIPGADGEFTVLFSDNKGEFIRPQLALAGIENG